MINSYLSSQDFSEETNSTYYDFDLTLNDTLIGRYNISVSETDIYLGIFQINEDYQGKGYGRQAILEVKNTLEALSKEHNIKELEICAKPFENSPLTLEELGLFYQKYLNVKTDYDNGTSFIMRGVLS